MKRIVQITAGKGPAECAWVVAKVLKYFLVEAREHQLKTDILKKENGLQNGTVQSVSIALVGKDLDTFLSPWLGTIQWIGQSPYRKQHQRKNWFIGLFEVHAKESLVFQETDIAFQAMRRSGPGGQHVNKVSSAIRATHIPTRIAVVVSNSRSQQQNKKLAVMRLREKVYSAQRNAQQEQLNKIWENHHHLERGNPIRIFKGTDFKYKKEIKSYKSVRQQLKNNLKNTSWD
ncbi:peptide chain release factor H [Spongiimicrobium salis]|uniref:peptide chain release factor H n=1 Tax=Spongiimicrobium salis TaxID=1667022 RepID=UPI00374D4628